MARYYGSIGYSETVETAPGVWSGAITERKYYGEFIKISRRWQSSENLNDDLTMNNQLSILADAYAYENFQNMKYVNHMGSTWKITGIEVQRPRIILSIGGVYNGPKATTP